ncbi:hypothetical protein IFM89_004047 [Coptis chinensis]|uniref:CCHC-type domain-containing protein n=1 Tax=Coptis chinensis TaxID=261450 RepID=A0A835LDA7_9MAGN|nr:hypothetical protein IFM89_004047 [Coptis chinensis]
MERDCLAKRNLMLHYHGAFQEAPDDSLYAHDNYRGGVMEKMRNMDGDKINYMNLVDDLKENYLFDISAVFEVLYLCNGEKVYVKNDNDLMQMWANMDEDISGWSHVFVEFEEELIELVETMIVPTPQVSTPKSRKNVKKKSKMRRSMKKKNSIIKDIDGFYTNKCLANASPPHISKSTSPNKSTPPTQFSPPPQPAAPIPIDDIEDDEGYRSTHSSEDEEDHVITEKVDFVDFIAVTDNMEDGDEGSGQSVNKPTVWEVAYFRRQDDGFTMKLNTLKAVHTCKADCDMFNRMANANWVVRKIEDQMKVCSNFSESFNSWILELKNLSIVSLLDQYHLLLMSLRYKRKQARKGWDQNGLVPRVNKNIAKMIDICPSYIFEEYTLAYMSNVKPMKDVKDWPKPDPTKLIKPPPLVRGIGRPKKQRMHAEDENEMVMCKKKRKMTCSKCKGEGHNARSCKGFSASEIASNAKNKALRLKPKPWTRSRTVTRESTCMDRAKKIVRKTQGGIRKAKKKSSLQSGSDAPLSESIAESTNNAPLSESISEPPSNAPVRVVPIRHEHPKKSQNYGPILFKAPEHRHTMDDLIRKQGEGKMNSASVIVATRQVVKGAGATFASVIAPFKAPAVVKGTTRNKAQASVTAPVYQNTSTCETSTKEAASPYPPPGFAHKPSFTPPPRAKGFGLKFPPKAKPQPTAVPPPPPPQPQQVPPPPSQPASASPSPKRSGRLHTPLPGPLQLGQSQSPTREAKKLVLALAAAGVCMSNKKNKNKRT